MFILFIDFDNARILALIPEVEVIVDIIGNFLNPKPPDAKLIDATPPKTLVELVLYDKLSVSVDK